MGLFGFGSSNVSSELTWNNLININQLDEILLESNDYPIAIFKHSTRCSISSSALSRLERQWKNAESKQIKPYFLDLLEHRDISNEIQFKFNVVHESPQIILINKGKVIYHASHSSILFEDVINAIHS